MDTKKETLGFLQANQTLLKEKHHVSKIELYSKEFNDLDDFSIGAYNA